MKAYVASCIDDDHGARVVFAENIRDARRKAPYDCDCSFVQRRTRRAPDLDGYVGKPPTLRTLVEKHGWSIRCAGCDRDLYAGESHVWIDDQTCYCDSACKASHERDVAAFMESVKRRCERFQDSSLPSPARPEQGEPHA